MSLNREMINEGIIDIDTESAKLLGFTSDRFDPLQYPNGTGDTQHKAKHMAGRADRLRQAVQKHDKAGDKAATKLIVNVGKIDN